MNNNNSNKHVIIIGGGIGGMAAGIALRQSGFKVSLYERVAQLQEVGAGLTLWTNAVKALYKLGMREVLEEMSIPAMSSGIFSAQGEVLARTSTTELAQKFGAPNVTVHRAELQAALLEKFGLEGVYINKKLAEFRQDSHEVTACFTDSEEVRGDVLIGADGIHSVVRVQLWGESKLRYAGYTA